MDHGIRSQIASAALEEISQFAELGRKEKTMIQEGDLAGFEQYLKHRSQTLRRNLWFQTLTMPLWIFFIGWISLRDLIALDVRQAVGLRMLLLLILLIAGNVIVTKVFLNQISRTDRGLVYLGILSGARRPPSG